MSDPDWLVQLRADISVLPPIERMSVLFIALPRKPSWDTEDANIRAVLSAAMSGNFQANSAALCTGNGMCPGLHADPLRRAAGLSGCWYHSPHGLSFADAYSGFFINRSLEMDVA